MGGPGSGGHNRRSAAEHKARGTYRADRHGEPEAPAPVAPTVLVRPPATQRILEAEELLAGIPDHDPRDLAGDCVFDYEAAMRPIRFFHERLSYPRGEKKGQAFALEPWQQAIVGNLFGWKRPDGTRRYRRVFVYVPKKNGKTGLLAGIVLYVLLEDGEPASRVFSSAYNKEQASLIYRDAAAMALADPELDARVKIYGFRGGSQQRSVVLNADPMSVYRPLAAGADGADGEDVHFAANDELHRHRDDGALVGILEDGMSARRQPISFTITTADYDRESACNRALKLARAVRDNGGDSSKPGNDPYLLPVIYEASRKDDWKSEKVWFRVNPNLGVSKKVSYMREKVMRIREDPTLLDKFLRLDLNVLTSTKLSAFDMAKWDACAGLDRKALRGSPCWGGLDLSKTIDQTAFVLWFPALAACLCWHWIPEETARQAEHRDKVPYSVWTRDGWLEQTPGNVVDYPWVKAKILQACEAYRPVAIGYDTWNAEQMAQELQNEGLTMTKFIQGPRSYNEPCKELSRLVTSGEFQHGGNPVLRDNASKTMWRTDANGNWAPDKQGGNVRIDGVVALCMAIGVSIAEPAEPESNLEKYGIRRL